jgi:hypothetical protein
MVEAIACFFLISFPLAVWVFFTVAKRMYRHHPDDSSLLGKLLSSRPAPRLAAVPPADGPSRAGAAPDPFRPGRS